MLQRIFIATIEVRPLVGSSFDPGEICGAAVRCYIPADDGIEARRLLTMAVTEHHFELVEIEFCHPADSEWAKVDDGSDATGG